ncbi:hypothetical protein IVB38_03580 [Bradyrhizobium sp. 38]|uniref:alpha/beta hydrolase family protein n=1 Tax=unclassified Bradyrhizobium TaxID=2631580 RepID=UPI001FFA2730|nr:MULTISPECIES: hypothetical protein [unclassified Bradyrhizobium]MCK1335142.1 hypothetical protein [Bradyrhizobium sp. 38]MCK1776702.1 hypothetical protein [Bradyrhizobium sp. 132]
MEFRAEPHARGNLVSKQRDAAVFLDRQAVKNIQGAICRKNSIARWTKAGDDQCLVSEQNIKRGAFDEATQAWLCGLTAFEVARRLTDESDAKGGGGGAKVEDSIHRFTLLLDQKVERITIARCDKTEFLGYYFLAKGNDSCSPAVICISREQETGAMLLGRLLPVLIGRGMSVLAISHDDVSSRSRGQSEIFLSYCLDFLSVQAGVDPTRIGVYGDGLSASLATDFAASDRRVAAAVCDGGLWNWTRTLASVGWMTRAEDAMEEDVVSMRRSQLVRRLRCPVLVVAGGRGIVSLSEAIKLQADCMAARIDLQLVMPRTIRIPEEDEELENFVVSDNCIFQWLEQKLARTS